MSNRQPLTDEQFDIIETLEGQGYSNFENKDGRLCALYNFIFTVAIVVGIDENGYECRYCYGDLNQALSAYNDWNGIGDPEGYIVKKG